VQRIAQIGGQGPRPLVAIPIRGVEYILRAHLKRHSIDRPERQAQVPCEFLDRYLHPRQTGQYMQLAQIPMNIQDQTPVAGPEADLAAETGEPPHDPRTAAQNPSAPHPHKPSVVAFQLGGFQSSVQHKLSLCRGPLCRRLTVRLSATTVEVFDAAQLVAHHERAVGRHVEVLTLDHYPEVDRGSNSKPPMTSRS
jgi:hypothetical protein